MSACQHLNVDYRFERMGGQIISRRWVACVDCPWTAELPNDLDAATADGGATPATRGDMSESVTIPTMDDMQRLVGAFGNANFDCGAHDDSSDMTYGDVLEKSHAARANLVAAIQQLHDAAIGIVREPTLRAPEVTDARCESIQTDAETYWRQCIHVPEHSGPCDFDISETKNVRRLTTGLPHSSTEKA
jgi:hypothetical protein